MAIEATKIYRRHAELFDEEAKAMLQSGELRTHLQSLRLSETPSQSRSLIARKGPCLIMAGAGMCNGGRIVGQLRAGVGLNPWQFFPAQLRSHEFNKACG